MEQLKDILAKYLDLFQQQEGYFVADNRILEAFKMAPENINVDDVRVKVSALNDPEIEDNALIDGMAKHIVALRPDERLRQGDLALVEEVAALNVRHRDFHPIHFASAYCCFHQPTLFPIYSEQFLELYRRYIIENSLPVDPSKINTYPVFARVLDDVMTRFHLKGKLNYLHFRKFGWLYAEDIFREAGILS